MDRYDEKAQDVFTELAGDWNTVCIVPKFAQALRESAADAYEDAVKVLVDNEEAGRTAKLILIDRIAAIRT